MGSHSVTCHPTEVTFPPLPQPKLVLDLAIPKGCKAELTRLVLRRRHAYTLVREAGTLGGRNAGTGLPAAYVVAGWAAKPLVFL